MKVLLLGAGPVPDESEAPVWLAEQKGRLLVERFVTACKELQAQMIFAVRAADMRRFHLDHVISLAVPGAIVVPVVGETRGAACTALLCIEHISPDDELLIISSNEVLDIDYAEPVRTFRARGFDAGVVTFPSLHPRYSYVLLDECGHVVEASEKKPISRHATAGFNWFARGSDFITAAQDMIRKDAHVDGMFYISQTLNELVLRRRCMGTFPMEARQYRPLKSRRQVDIYEAEGADS